MRIIPCLSLCLLVTPWAKAVLVDIPAAKDTTLYESQTGSLANGGGSYFFAGRTVQQTGSIRRGLIEFDLTSFIPAGAVVNSAELVLNADKGGNGSTVVTLHRLTREWTEGGTVAPGSEGGGGANILGSDATWLHATSNSVLWTGAGAAGDYELTPSGSQTIGNTGSAYSWPGLASEVQSWLADAGSNHGWLLLGDEVSPSSAVRFASRNNGSAELQPVLRVDFTAVPEPSVLMLATALLGAGLRHRKRAGHSWQI